MNRISKIMAAMMALVLCVAMVTVATAEGINVVFIPKLSGNAFFESANVGAQDFAALNGFTVTYDGNPEASAANQVAIVQNAITSGADAICISTVDAAGVNDALKEAAEAGLVVTTWDSDSLPESRSIMVSQGTLAASLTERGKDVTKDAIKYVWHYSQATVTDQNSWHVAGEVYVAEKYPNWINVFPDNYYSEQDAEKAITVGESILSTYPDIDGIICNDSTALPGQAQAAQNLGLDATKVSITGFAAPNSMKDYCRAGILTRWGLWDCKIQGALGCYMAYLLASGQEIKVGDTIDVPGIGAVTVEPNTVLDPNAFTSETSGVVLLPERAVFTIENMDNYNF
jgi:AI-2 transport system substrate-binding protein